MERRRYVIAVVSILSLCLSGTALAEGTSAVVTVGGGAVEGTAEHPTPGGGAVEVPEAPTEGWQSRGGAWYYQYADGTWATDRMTPDGYYVDGNGAWYRRTESVLGTSLTAPERFVRPDDMGAEWQPMSASLQRFQAMILQAFPKKRGLKLSREAVTYLEGEKKILLGLYRDTEINGYRLDLRTKLDVAAADNDSTRFDYQLMKGLVYQFSSTPELVTDAVYQAWMDGNAYGINRVMWVPVGDCELKYEGGDGYGKFFIRPRML